MANLGVSYSIGNDIKVRKIDELVNLPKFVLVNEFNEASAKAFQKDFQDALNTEQQVVPVIIDSYGGQVYSLLSMCGIIKSSPVPVATICVGKSMSCGSVLLSCGTEGLRYIDPYATVLIHSVSGGAFGKVSEMESRVLEARRLNTLIFHIMAQNLGKKRDYFLDLLHDKEDADVFLTPEDCVKHNLANHIGTPRFFVRVDSTVEFGV